MHKSILPCLLILHTWQASCSNNFNRDINRRNRQTDSQVNPASSLDRFIPDSSSIQNKDNFNVSQSSTPLIVQNSSNFEQNDQAPQLLHQLTKPAAGPQSKVSNKWFRAETFTDYSVTTTTLWYYSDHGKSYTFEIDGDLPAHRSKMIDWIEHNSHNYTLTYIDYMPYGSPKPDATTSFKWFRAEAKTNDTGFTLWYYSNHGKSYTFEIDGDLPANNSEMIDWIENNSHNYTLTEIDYKSYGSPDHNASLPISEHQPPQEEPLSPQTSPTTSVGTPWDGNMPDSCGRLWVRVEDKVVSGDDSTIQRNPWQVAILRSQSLNFLCGGTIITQRHIITAAHCFFQGKSETPPLGAKDIKILAGYTDIKAEDKVLYDAQDIFLHEHYAQEHRRNDISLVFMREPFVFTASIHPICLPNTKTASYKAGRTCRKTGWRSPSNTTGGTTVLEGVEASIMTEDQCKDRLDRHNPIGKSMFCAADYLEHGEERCAGYSGGPFACADEGKYYLYGITSLGYGCGRRFYPGVYTMVASYSPWIQYFLEQTKTYYDKNAFTALEPDPDHLKMVSMTIVDEDYEDDWIIDIN